MNETGFIALYRSLLDWEYFNSSSAVHLWIYLLLRANWKDGSFMGEKVPRGSMVTSMRRISSETDLSVSTIKRWLSRFEDAGMIERKATNRWTIIKVLNYSTFQGIVGERVNQQMNHQVNQPVNHQMNQQMNHNRTKKQSNKETKEQSLSMGGFVPPGVGEIQEYIALNNYVVDAREFFDHYESIGWKVGKAQMKDWKAAVRSWQRKREKEIQNKRRLPF